MNQQRVRHLFGAVLLFTLSLSAGASAAGFDDELRAFWRESYNRIDSETKITALKKNEPFPAQPKPYDHQYIYKIGSLFEGEVNVILRRTQALIDELSLMPNAPSLGTEQNALNKIKQTVNGVNGDTTIFFEVCALSRQIAMKNPLLNFDSMIFNCFGTEKPQFHSQQIAWFAIPDKDGGGTGLYKVSGFKEGKPVYNDLLDSSKVINGRYKDKILSNKNPEWKNLSTVFTPELSYDGKKIMFAWAAAAGWRGATYANKWHLTTKYRIYELDVAAQSVRMLSDFGDNPDSFATVAPNMDEYDPTYLPNDDRILFVSERHNGGQRCGNTATSGNMYTMKLTDGPDKMGSDIVRLSWHETNERSPAIDLNGKIVYSRWDYIDRHAYSAQSMWLVNPDGTDPRVYHGNYMEDDKPFHPISECDIRPIPGSEGKYMGIAAGHHEAYRGNLCVIDINKPAKTDHQIRWFFAGWATPGDVPVQTQGKLGSQLKQRLFETPWPLNEKFVIVAHYGEMLLLDEFRNEILLFSNKTITSETGRKNVFVQSPIPLKTRTKEPILASGTCQGKSCNSAAANRATISVINVYNTDTPWPAHIKIKQLRICQLVPRPKKPWETNRNEWWGWSDGALLKAVIGTVPVELDGSAYFRAPIEREIFFQAIDSTGMAVTSMLSGTYVHPGEHLTCLGCHEDKWTASPALKGTTTHALQKGPAPITPEMPGSYPLTYARLVRDSVFYPRCLPCHKQNGVSMDFSYWKAGSTCNNGGEESGPCVGDMEKFVTYYGAAYQNAYGFTPQNMLMMGFPDDKLPENQGGTTKLYRAFREDYGVVRSRSVPMRIGARACSLLTYLYPSHHGVELSDKEFRRAVMWMDLNSQNLGTYQFTDDPGIRAKPDDFDATVAFTQPGPYKRQHDGLVVWPSWEGSGFDSANVTGEQQFGKPYPAYNPDAPVGVGFVTSQNKGAHSQLLVRGGQLVLTNVTGGNLEVTLFNLAGRAVVRKTLTTFPAASVNLVSTRALGAGTFVARMRLNGETLQGKNLSILITD
jgi:hypothetical protein